MESTPKPLSQLQSRAQIKLLDAVDRLRLDGFQGELDLPQLIVCGDQSSGKSSVLEAISGVRFPASDVFCTRFASELVLRRAPTASMTVRIEPAIHRSESQRRHLVDGFRPPQGMSKPEDFAKAIESAGRHIIGLDTDDAFYEDKLIAVIRGPEQPQLTLVDLPGLIHASNKEQGDKDIDTVKTIVESYMAMPSSIILAILAADNNFANQVVLQLAKAADPQARRTLGIITKPDRVEQGSRSEASCIEHAQNRNTYLELGWHVLRNRSFENADASTEERNALEVDFFRGSSWNQLDGDNIGADALRSKLSRVLLQSLRRSLPSLINDIKQRVANCEALDNKLGKPKMSEIEQRVQLSEISRDLHDLTKSAVEGNYRDSFFDDQGSNSLSERRLRARLRDILEEFSDHMHASGHSYEVLKNSKKSIKAVATGIDFSPDSILRTGHPVLVTKQAFLEAIEERVRRNRGRELEGMCQPEIVADVFRSQSAPWEQIALFFTDKCRQAVQRFYDDALQHVGPSHIAEAVAQHYTVDCMQQASERLEAKVKELLKPYRNGHLVTLDTSYLRRKVENERKKRETPEEQASDQMVATEVAGSANSAATAVLVFDYMRAYYEIALRTFVDNVANLAVENCLVDSILGLFTPVTVAAFDSTTVRNLTLEPSTVLRDREMNRRRQQTLRHILDVCNKHGNRFCGVDSQASGGGFTPADPDDPNAYHSGHQEPRHGQPRAVPTFQMQAGPKMPYDQAYNTPPHRPESFPNVETGSKSRQKRPESESIAGSASPSYTMRHGREHSPSPSRRHDSYLSDSEGGEPS